MEVAILIKSLKGEGKRKLKRDKVFRFHLERSGNLKQQPDVWQVYAALKPANPANGNTDFVGQLPLAHLFNPAVVSDLFTNQERFITSFRLRFFHALKISIAKTDEIINTAVCAFVTYRILMLSREAGAFETHIFLGNFYEKNERIKSMGILDYLRNGKVSGNLLFVFFLLINVLSLH